MGQKVTMIDKRTLIAASAVGALSLAGPRWAFAKTAGVQPKVVDLAVSSARSTKLVVWAPPKPKGVALFSTGHGAWPERYQQLADLLAGEGFAVLSPVHVDSVHYPERDRFTLQQSFPERLADMGATAAYAAKTYPDLPTIAVGHSFGTLTALCLGGALSGMGPFRNPAVKAVLGFSTPGRIPGLIGADAYSGLAVPVMIVTGTADLVPGFVTDPANHRFPAETARAGSYLLVEQGADHLLVATPAFARAVAPARLFVEAYGLGRADARRRLDTYRAASGDIFQHKVPA